MISDMDVAFFVLMFNLDGPATVGHPLERVAIVDSCSIPVGSFLAGSFHYHALERSN